MSKKSFSLTRARITYQMRRNCTERIYLCDVDDLFFSGLKFIQVALFFFCPFWWHVSLFWANVITAVILCTRAFKILQKIAHDVNLLTLNVWLRYTVFKSLKNISCFLVLLNTTMSLKFENFLNYFWNIRILARKCNLQLSISGLIRIKKQ